MMTVGQIVILRDAPKDKLLNITAYLVWPSLPACVSPLVNAMVTSLDLSTLSVPFCLPWGFAPLFQVLRWWNTGPLRLASPPYLSGVCRWSRP